MNDFAALTGLTAAGSAAAWLLRGAQRRRGVARTFSLGAGWFLVAIAVAGAGLVLGTLRGVFAAIALVPVGALVFVATALERRAKRAAATRTAPAQPAVRGWHLGRGFTRAVLAGPLGGAAAMGTGIACMALLPGDPQTRIVLGGVLVPVFWAGGMVWTLADAKLVRATAVLAGVAFVALAVSVVKGFG